MNIFTKKSFMKKIAIICLFLVIFNFTGISQVQAANDDSSWGGKLLASVISLFVAIADGAYSLANKCIMGDGFGDALVEVPTVSSGFWEGAKNFLLTAILGPIKTLGDSISDMVQWFSSESYSGEEVSGEIDNKLFRGVIYREEALPDKIYLPFFNLHLGSIFAGDILLFDVNFFEEKKPKEYRNDDGSVIYFYDKNGDGNYQSDTEPITSPSSASYQLRGIVSSWYYRLRNIAIIVSMLVLIYIGIRIIFSSLNPNGKAKYKNMLMDWIVSICLIFCMHYIMLFSVKLVEYATSFIDNTSTEGGQYIAFIEPNGIMKDNLEELGLDIGIQDGASAELEGNLFAFPTNMFGYIRIMSQFSVGFTYVGYAIIYIIGVLFILFFTFTYLKRVLYMAFLTIVAPLVALTYPIDKINDGSAQAFNMWLKEYIFNLLIQPLHLLLYYILISSAFSLASENFIYAIVAIAFMVPAEKIMRKFFGFDKAQTPGLLAGAGGAALAMSGLKTLNRFAKGGKGQGGPGGKDGKKEDSSPKFKQTKTFDELAGDGEGNSSDETAGKSGGQNNNQEENGLGDNSDGRDEILEKYNQQGYGQNEDGEYYNPWTDEYDAYYDPHNDSSYQLQQEESENNQDTNASEDSSNQSGNDNIIKFGDTKYTGRKGKEKTIGKNKAFARVIGRRTLAAGKRLGVAAAKTGAKVAGAGVLGLAGGIIGLASGDMKTVVSSTATGGAIGSAIGERVFNEAGGIKNKVRAFEQEVANETNDDDERNEMARRQFMRDKQIRKIYEQELGIKGPNKKEQVDEAMKAALKYKEYGVNNDKIIAQAMKEQGLGVDPTDRKRIMAAKIAEKVNGSQKTFEDQMTALQKKRNYSDEQITRLRQAVAHIDGNVA